MQERQQQVDERATGTTSPPQQPAAGSGSKAVLAKRLGMSDGEDEN